MNNFLNNLKQRRKVELRMGFFADEEMNYVFSAETITKSQAIGMMHKKYREAILRRPNAPKDRFSETLYEIKID